MYLGWVQQAGHREVKAVERGRAGAIGGLYL